MLPPDAPGWQAALDSGGAANSAAAYTYRRSEAGRWTAGSFVKAPNPRAGDEFGYAVALSAGGDTLAVGAPGEDGAARDAPPPSATASATALRSQRRCGLPVLSRPRP